MKKARIIGMGSYLPKRVLTNQDLEEMVDTSDEWIVSRTGIRERRLADADEFTSDMAAAAAKKALEQAKIQPEAIDLILVATLTPDYIFPSTACLVQASLQATHAAGLDIQAACTGLIYGLSMAKAFIESGIYQNVLVIAAEKLSSIVNYKDRTTCVLFGDGAAACVVGNKGAGLEITSSCLGADGEQSELLIMPAGGSRNPTSAETLEQGLHYIRMTGSEVFKHAVRRMGSACKECLKQADLTEKDVSWVIPHQANERIIDAIAKRFQHLSSDHIYKTVHKYGNTSASSVGIALDELIKEGTVATGENILLTAFGSGFTWGATILKKIEG